MWTETDPLEMTCPKCSADLALELGDIGSDAMRCPVCGFRLDLDPTLLEDGFQDLWPDEADARLH